jgi:hypothetical protein
LTLVGIFTGVTFASGGFASGDFTV